MNEFVSGDHVVFTNKDTDLIDKVFEKRLAYTNICKEYNNSILTVVAKEIRNINGKKVEMYKTLDKQGKGFYVYPNEIVKVVQ